MRGAQSAYTRRKKFQCKSTRATAWAGSVYLFPSCGAAFCTLHGAPLGASALLGDTSGHVHTVVQKHLLPHAAHQLLLLWLGHNLLHTAFAATATVGQVPRGTAVPAVGGQHPWSREGTAISTGEAKGCKVKEKQSSTG